MTSLPPENVPPPGSPDLAQPDDTMQAVGAVSLRLLAGAVPKKTMEQLQRTVQQSPAEYPWQAITQAVLAEPVEPQKLVQQGLQAQRDWILRGGREKPGPSLGRRTKGFLARLCAQAIFALLFAVVLIAVLVLVQYKKPELDIYRIVPWVQSLLGTAR